VKEVMKEEQNRTPPRRYFEFKTHIFRTFASSFLTHKTEQENKVPNIHGFFFHPNKGNDLYPLSFVRAVYRFSAR
jgi:hypothetical protein